MKILPVGAEFFLHGRTDITKLIVAFRCFANAPKEILLHEHSFWLRVYWVSGWKLSGKSVELSCRLLDVITVSHLV